MQADTKNDGRTRKPYVLHVSGDFPDCFEGSKTAVIKSLIDLTADRFDHQLVSINRSSPTPGQAIWDELRRAPLRIETQTFPYGDALRYFAPPHGLFHRTKLHQLGDELAKQIASASRRPDLLVGHKLAIEGIAVRRAASRLGIPYAVSIQGDTDTKIMNVRPDLAGELRKVADDAAVIFPFAPWAWDATIAKLGQPDTPHILLPCPTDIDDPLAPKPNGTGIVSIFHLKSYKRKNLANLARSIRLLEKDGDAPPLSVIGGGETRDIKACEKLVAGIPSIALEGPLGRDEVRARMNAASGFVLPSLRETFGLVFVEALFAGTPIIYPQGTSVDGYFDDTPFAISVDPRDPRSIADAIRYVRANERELKLELANWQSSVGAEFFRRAHIAASFAKGLEQAMASQRQAIARP